MNRRSFFTAAAGGTAVALLPNLGEAQSTPSSAATSVHATTAKLLIGQFHQLQKDPKHNILASGKVSTAFRMQAEVMQADGTNARIETAIRNGASTVYTKEYLDEQYRTLAKLGVHLTHEQKAYATSQLVSASREASPMVRQIVSQGGGIVKLQQAAHSALIGHQIGRRTASSQMRAVMPHVGITDAVFYPHSRPILKRVDDTVWVYTDGWDDDEYIGRSGGGGAGDGPGLLQDSGNGTGGAPVADPNAPEVNVDGKHTEVVTPSGAHVQACTVYYSTLAFLAGVGGSAVAFADAVGIEVGIAVGAAVLSAGAIVALAGILVAIWGFLAVIC